MEITIRRSGGFAGLTQTWTVDSGTCHVDVLALVQRLKLSAEASSLAPRPDQFTYVIAMRGTEVSVQETDLDPELRSVIRAAQQAETATGPECETQD